MIAAMLLMLAAGRVIGAFLAYALGPSITRAHVRVRQRITYRRLLRREPDWRSWEVEKTREVEHE